MTNRESWSSKLRNAVIQYYYQPIYNVYKEKIDRAEVLIRIQDEDGGFYDTDLAVAAAEELALIDEMDRQTFIHTCGVLPEMEGHGIFQLSVNLSPTACRNPHLAWEIQRVLLKSGVRPSGICLEITETAKLLDEEQVFEPLQYLRNLGVKIALDDFGKGYSNLQRLINVSIHTLKLDKSIVWSMGKQRLATPMVKNIVRFCVDNDIEVVAEGIETAEQANILCRMGCQYLQGYYFGKPLEKYDLLRLLDSQQRLISTEG